MSSTAFLYATRSNHASVTQSRSGALLLPLRYTFTQFSQSRAALNGEELIIAKKIKDGWSVRTTGDFDGELLDDIFDDLDSEEIQLAFEAQDVVEELMIKAEVNAKAREIIWEDGQILSLRDSIERLAGQCPQYPFDMLERQFIVWLEHFPPESYSQAQLDEYEALSDRWLDDYAREFGLQR